MSVREGYKQTEVGVIPEEWEVVKLGDILTVKGGNAFKSSDFKEKGISVLKISNITKNATIDLSDSSKVDEKETYSQFLLKENDIIIAMSGATTGKIGKVKKNDLPVYLNQRVGKFELVKKDLLNNIYLYFNVTKNNFLDKLLINAIGGAQPNISSKQIENLKIPLPPLPEQQKIAAILTSVNNKVEVIDAQIAKTETLKKGLMQKLLSEGIGHTEFKDSEIGRIPKEWEVVRLGDIIGNITGGVSVNSEDRKKHDNEIGILKTSAIAGGKFFPEEHKTVLKNEYNRVATNPLADHIIFSRMNTPLLVGESGYINKDYPDLYLPDRLWQIGVKSKENTNVKWLSYVLTSQRVKKLLKKAATGTSNSMKNISKPSLLKIKIPLPPLYEQKQIAKILSTTDNKLDTLRAKKEKYETLKKGLMQKLLTGEVRVKV